MFIHEDTRRRLIEWANGGFKSAKVVIAESDDCIVGDHHHLKKDEEFLLLEGKATAVTIGDIRFLDPPPLSYWEVPRGTYHRFDLCKGAVLLGVATELFDLGDEIAGRG